MATFDELLERRVLIRVTVRLRHDQFHERRLYAFPTFLEWVKNEVPKMVTGRLKAAQTPLEQLQVRLREWMAGNPMRYGRMFQDLLPRDRDYVWEMKTPDLRIFGWMYRPKQFIAVFGDFADDYKPPTRTKSYADARKQVVKARDDIPLDGDKYSDGDFDDLV